MDGDRRMAHASSCWRSLSPGIPAVETEGDLVHTARVTHHQVEARLKAKTRYEKLVSGNFMQKMQVFYSLI